jgi:RHS repeat-associated protein
MYPYGESWYTAGSSSPDQFMFTTYARDSESGLDYALARFYDSGMGRFCSADPIQGRPDDPQSWNRYAYVRNNPVNITDPSGKFWEFLINFLIDFITSLFSAGGADAAFGFSLGQAADTTVIVTADAVTLSTAQAAVIGGLEAGAGAAASAAAGQVPASQQPQQQPNNQQNTQNCFKNRAFPQAFGPNANNIDTDSARQLLANNGSNIINGHRNWIFPAQFANQTQADAFRNVLNNNTFMPFGSRIDVTINGQVGWGLHVTHAAFDGLSATFRGHLDIGDPNRDVVGIVKHIKDDFFGGHKKEADLDPKCNP